MFETCRQITVVAVRPLGEQLPDQTRSFINQLAQPTARAFRRLIIHHVRHRSAEHSGRSSGFLGGRIPFQWLIPVLVSEGPARNTFAPNPKTKPDREFARITVVTS